MNDPTMKTDHSSRDANRRRPPRSMTVRKALALSVLGVAAVTMAACGGSSSASTTSTTAKSSATGGSGGTGARTFPGTSGSIAAINGTSLEVQSSTSQTTVNYTTATTFGYALRKSDTVFGVRNVG